MIEMIYKLKSNLVEGSRVLLVLSGILLFSFISCDSENASDCFQETGAIVKEEVNVDEFSAITVFENVALVIKQGDTQKVTYVIMVQQWFMLLLPI